MLDALINLFGKMLQELVHILAFMLHDFISNVRSSFICMFKLMVRQSADFLGLFLGNVSVVGKNRCQYAAQMFHFFFSHFVFLLSEV